MICTKVVGHVHEGVAASRRLDRVWLHSEALLKRIQRLRTESGRELGLRLPADSAALRDGDILWMDDEAAVVVSVLPESVLVVSPKSLREMGEVAHRLGNRHVPAQFEGDTLIVADDPLLEQLFVSLEVPFVREERVLREPFRYIAEHGHGHSPGHGHA
ncbi:urease accessory protein UreE [Alicyclobacillus herbarius]|uniref:urease accessory protein UreE n=1 Tax=Alicyclobacillus herbarius TaxID=122960 RepID=UPI000429F10F|nr:urease accessory protein UreE [Alicyclobacillus herbarius]